MNINSKYKWSSLSALLVLIYLAPLKLSAEIYKCENIKKEIFYIDKPCPVLDKETEMAAVKDPKNGYAYSTLAPSNNKKRSQSIGNEGKRTNLQISIKDKNRVGKDSTRNSEQNALKKSHGDELVENEKHRESIVSSSGRKSVASRSSVAFDENSRYIMKVDKNIREPR